MVRACSAASCAMAENAWCACTIVMRSRIRMTRRSRKPPKSVGGVACTQTDRSDGADGQIRCAGSRKPPKGHWAKWAAQSGHADGQLKPDRSIHRPGRCFRSRRLPKTVGGVICAQMDRSDGADRQTGQDDAPGCGSRRRAAGRSGLHYP
jgi:hypothetical protein